jgi:hypothetical protein
MALTTAVNLQVDLQDGGVAGGENGCEDNDGDEDMGNNGNEGSAGDIEDKDAENSEKEKSGGEAMDTGEDEAVERWEKGDREDDGDVRMKDAGAGRVLRGTVRARVESSGQYHFFYC